MLWLSTENSHFIIQSDFETPNGLHHMTIFRLLSHGSQIILERIFNNFLLFSL